MFTIPTAAGLAFGFSGSAQLPWERLAPAGSVHWRALLVGNNGDGHINASIAEQNLLGELADDNGIDRHPQLWATFGTATWGDAKLLLCGNDVEKPACSAIQASATGRGHRRYGR
jgi:hypothetical protein